MWLIHTWVDTKKIIGMAWWKQSNTRIITITNKLSKHIYSLLFIQHHFLQYCWDIFLFASLLCITLHWEYFVHKYIGTYICIYNTKLRNHWPFLNCHCFLCFFVARFFMFKNIYSIVFGQLLDLDNYWSHNINFQLCAASSFSLNI